MVAQRIAPMLSNSAIIQLKNIFFVCSYLEGSLILSFSSPVLALQECDALLHADNAAYTDKMKDFRSH